MNLLLCGRTILEKGFEMRMKASRVGEDALGAKSRGGRFDRARGDAGWGASAGLIAARRGAGEVLGARASAMARAIAVDGRDPFSQPYLGRSSRLICSPRASSLCARHSRCCRLRARPRALFRHISLLCILRAPGLFAPPCGKTFDFWPRNRVLARWPRAFALKARPCIVKAQVSDFDRLDASSKRA